VTNEAVEKPLFTHELPADLSFPAAENSHRYQDAHKELYRYLIDGLDRECIARIADSLGKPKPREKWTVQDLKKVFPGLEKPAMFSVVYDLVSEQRRLASHNARPPAEAMQAFEQFTRDLDLCVTGLSELLSTLEKELRMNSAKATARHDAKEHLPKIVALASPRFSVCQASQMKGKTVARVEFGFAKVTEYAHRSELLIIHFTDGSIMSIDTHTNAGNLADEVTGLKPKDFDVSYSLRWVPPK
jgi:type VI protein secretion system component Hcp